MKNIFVVTDNMFIYNEFRRIVKSKNIKVDYYCSSKSNETFKNEILNKEIYPILLKSNEDNFLNNNYDLGISCHSKQLFPKAVVNNILCINIHPGLNPYNRGWFPQVFSIINGFPIGATIHVMDEEIDHGDIIIQEEVPLYPQDNSLDIYNRVVDKEIELLQKSIDNIINNNFNTAKPNSEGNYNSIQDYKKLCEIDLDKKVTMKEAIDFFRAMTHPPYKNSYFLDENGNKVFISLDLEVRKSEDL